jgi:HSP20 family protein
MRNLTKFDTVFNPLNALDLIFNDAYASLYPNQYSNRSSLKTDYFIEDDSIVLNVDVAGSSNEDVNVELDKDNYVLSVKVNKQYEKKENKPSFYLRERMISEQVRKYSLPSDTDLNSISADVKNGLLTVKASLVNRNTTGQATVPIKVN